MDQKVRSFDEISFLNLIAKRSALPDQTIRRIATAAKETSVSVERAILELGILDEETVFRTLADYLEVPFITLDVIELGLLQADLLRPDFMKRSLAVPMAHNDTGYVIATANPDPGDLLASISYLLEAPTTFAIATPTTIKAALDLLTLQDQVSIESATQSDVARLEALANDGPVITLVNDIISKAVAIGASDVHVESQQQGMRLRYRVDGVLQTDRLIPDNLRHTIASRLKIMANLNISEKRRPQDGRAELVVRGRTIDIRMSTIPTQHGESIVLRLLDRNRIQLDWDALQFPTDRVVQIEKLVGSPNGIFLVAGPTGSGKTTTLYTALRGINTDDRKIMTVEDPIEYSLEGVNQVQVEPAIDMSFAKALRAILRQDPNVVMVGEIRDEETADIAVRAALIGRLVLSTIHTNDAISAIDRLLDLGVAPYLIGATLRGVLSQRLVRKTCQHCMGGGCSDCNDTGKQGRMAVSEIVMVSQEVSEAISQGKRGVSLLVEVEKAGFVGIKAQIQELVDIGLVPMDEMQRALGTD